MKTFYLIILIFSFCAGFNSITAQNVAKQEKAVADDQETLTQILAEVKQLRLLLSKSNANLIRFQTAFERMKLQQARVDSLTKELDSIKNMNASMTIIGSRPEEQIKVLEERLQQETVPQRREMYEQQIQSFKSNVEFRNQQEARRKDREMFLTNQMQTEMTKLNELNSQLNEAEREVEAFTRDQ